LQIDLSGKNIIVTGGARGLGRACVQQFTESGARVALVDIDFKAAMESAARIDRATAYACDLENPDSLKVLHQKLTEPVRRHLAGREDEYTAAIPLRRLGKPEDVAQAVLFLSSPMSDYITGCVLDVNGGIYMN
jgi:3-oxoacyl-[acyl-carrier protein] reductase